MWHDVELRELRIFLVLADELHFGRTAERLGISQPGVSEAVRVLESRLGVKVFDRTSRRVRLTPAGEELKRDLTPALAALSTRRWPRPASSPAPSAGCCASASSSPPRARRSAGSSRRSRPATPPARSGSRRSRPSTPTGRCAGATSTCCATRFIDEPDLTAGTAFAYYPRALAVAATHRLASQNTVSIEDLANEDVALLPPTIPPAVYDLIVPRRTPSGHSIRRTQPVQTINEILSLVARGRIVHPTSSTVPIFNRDNIVLIPIEGLPPIPLGLVWCTSRENPHIRALNEVARSMIAAPGTAPFRARQP